MLWQSFMLFFINLNNSVFFFWSITAGLHEEAQALCFLFIIISFHLFIYFLLPTVFLSCCQNNFRYQHKVKAIECWRSSRNQRLLKDCPPCTWFSLQVFFTYALLRKIRLKRQNGKIYHLIDSRVSCRHI